MHSPKDRGAEAGVESKGEWLGVAFGKVQKSVIKSKVLREGLNPGTGAGMGVTHKHPKSCP